MAEPEGAKSPLFSIVRGTSAMPPDQQFRYLYTEVNRVLALMSTEVESLRKRLTVLEKDRDKV